MSKKIHTIQSSDKVEFDEQVNQFLESGGELMDGGYEVINNDDGVVYSQVIVFKKNCELEFYENGQLEDFRNLNEDGVEDGLWIQWYENGHKEVEGTFKDGRLNGLYTRWYENEQKEQEGTMKNGGDDGLWIQWYETGEVRDERIYKDYEIISQKRLRKDGTEKHAMEL